MLWLFQRTMFGEPEGADNQNMTDLNLRQLGYMSSLVILMFWIGLYPKPFLTRVQPTVDHYVGEVQAKHQAYLEATGQVRAAEATPQQVLPAKKTQKGEH
jgi:NADH-quinone oxidoreductase subunit M